MNNQKSSPSRWEHFKAILQLPFIVALIIPLLIHFFTKDVVVIPICELPFWQSAIIGGIFLTIGLTLFVKSLQLFDKIGKGTLAPWNPTSKMIIVGLYRHVRNPMIIGVVFILLAEAFLLQTGNILIFTGIFVTLKTLYFIFDEEPTMRKRYGAEYLAYSKHVPRWIPRIKGWTPHQTSN